MGNQMTSVSNDEMYARTIQSILTMNRTLRKHAKAINSEQISGRQLATLSHLAETGECTAGALARDLFINDSSMSENLRKLKHKGLITKVRSEQDNRVVTVAITKEGRELVNRLPPAGIILLRGRLKQLDPKELKAINKAVEKLNKLMEAE
jgi:DNA-binding MarR family transcriptional regulator